MLTTILAFVVRYKTWFIYGAIILASLFALRLYGNAQWNKGVEYGDTRTAVKLQKEYEARWATESKKLDLERERLQSAVIDNDNNRKNIAQREADLARARQDVSVVLKQAMAMAQASIAAGYNTAGSVPDAQLVAAIRAISAELERDRTAATPK